MPTKAREWIVEVIKGLGIDPSYTTNIVVELDAQDLVKLKIEAYAPYIDNISELLRQTGDWVDYITVTDGESDRKLERFPSPALRERIIRLNDADLEAILEERRQFIKEWGER
jgi:hypothetical protein